ncbi:MAG TPA: hypothetical protein DEQ30_12335 [Porphyromonadaceae bacterium]|nr:hypothetical protein [Porphyromonadaceae bacterium]
MRIYDGLAADNYDALFVSASEYASEDRYEIGRDVIKMGTVGSGLQIWSPGYETALCATEVLFSGGRAEIPMYVHTPVSGREYVLRLENAVNYNGQLWLCRDKKLVQNLTEYPDYVIEGTGGTSDEYSLCLLSGTTFTESLAPEVYVYTEKNRIVLSGLPLGVEYLIYDMSGRLFSTGKSEGVERIGVYAMSGVYVVQINGKIYKAVVK